MSITDLKKKIIYKIYSAPIKRQSSLRRIQFRVVLYNEIGHNPRDPANNKSASMQEKRLAKKISFDTYMTRGG